MKGAQTFQEAIQFFSDYENCRQFMIEVRWSDRKVRCPYCGSEKVTYLEKARLYRCYGGHPKQKFSLKIGTVFEDSPIPLEKWLPATWMLSNRRNGVSSYEIHRALGVTQKSAWFMMHRIRLAMQSGTFRKLGGPGNEVESDETFIGGKAKNMHANRRAMSKLATESATMTGSAKRVNKSAVWGVLDRQQRQVRAMGVPKVNREALQTAVLNQVEHRSKIYTDEANVYKALPNEYTHQFVNHLERHVDGQVHTNGLENFWSLTKRALGGTYIAVESFHLHRYLDETMWRYNDRKDESGRKLTDGERFTLALSQIVGKRLTFAEATGKVKETPF